MTKKQNKRKRNRKIAKIVEEEKIKTTTNAFMTTIKDKI